ncbi:MAG TPA: hypothetical protein DD640_01300, partial [Clostridiales bacterium]|nr:hypothetical protein [Clostridiales bacterium]
IQGDALLMRVHGVRFPYRLQKKIRFRNSRQLSIEYQAENPCNFDLDFLWAAHLMLNVETGGEIVLPYGEAAPVTCVFASDPGFGSRGGKMDWPLARRADGGTQDLRLTPPLNPRGNTYKYYFDQKFPEGWCGYRYPSDGSLFKMLLPADRVPYLCVWVNEGAFHGYRNIAMEACTGTYDRPDLARMYGQNSVLPAKGQYDWYLDLAIEG